MTKYEFLGDLSRLLSQLSAEERDEAIKFYEDYFDEAGKEKEAEVIEELGSPQEVARKILQENEEEIPVSEAKREEGKEVEPYIHIQTKKESDYDSESGNRKENRWKDWDRNKILLMILLLIIVVPTVGGVLAGGIGGAFGVLVAIFAVGIVILALGMAGIVCGISMFIGGLASIPSGVGVGLILSGAGLLVTAICVAVMILGSWLAFRVIPWVIRSIIAVIRRAFSPRKQITD